VPAGGAGGGICGRVCKVASPVLCPCRMRPVLLLDAIVLLLGPESLLLPSMLRRDPQVLPAPEAEKASPSLGELPADVPCSTPGGSTPGLPEAVRETAGCVVPVVCPKPPDPAETPTAACS
jgi:hypothetical protein